VLSPEGRYACVQADKSIYFLRLVERKEPAVPAGEAVEVQRFEGFLGGWMGMSPNGRILVTLLTPPQGESDFDLQLWDVTTGKKHHRLKGHRLGVDNRVFFSPDGNRIVSTTAERDGNIRIWDVDSGRVLQILRHEGPAGEAWVTGVVFAADGKSVYSSGNDGTVRRWDVETGKEVMRLEVKPSYPRCVAVSRDGRYVAIGAIRVAWSTDTRIRVWETETGKEIQPLKGHALPGKGPGKDSGVTGVFFSSDGKRLLSAGYDDCGRVWDLASGKEVQRFENTGYYTAFTWSPKMRTILTIPSDRRRLRLWDVETGKELPGFSDPRIFNVGARLAGISDDGRFALCVFADETARLWRLPDLFPPEKP
jgi:WD40 repeat protein